MIPVISHRKPPGFLLYYQANTNIMIARIWHGKTNSNDFEAYTEFLKKIAIPDYQKTPGFKGLSFLRQIKVLFKGNFVVRGLEFGLVYSVVALVPVMWITFSSLDITFIMVLSWFFYGLCQAVVAGLVFAKVNP